ncbi:MAG: RNA exonuclease 3 [Alectoria fallacina]|uniref:RNA exonuclease 3 n=1 Tax=Alectoria fallacina TaxID=1903189 RepID=A0A8H3I8Q4_9LECA|nr:MAG: RNA exonuclease 3 [Alectoria fallacina]
MFSSIGLFKLVDCPEQPHCSLSNCIFAHHSVSEVVPATVSLPKGRLGEEVIDQNGPRKKRRLTLPGTASKDISPPPRSLQSKTVASVPASLNISSIGPKPKGALSPGENVELSLNPKMIQNPPAAHGVRIQLISMIHEQMVRLNGEVKQSQDSSQNALKLSPQELIIEALEQEENIAKQNPAVYLNIIKLRITKLKKMKFAEWKEERLKQIAKRAPVELILKTGSAPKSIETGLSSSQEIAFLSKLLAKQGDLARHGYVPHALRDEEIAQARSGVEAAQGWEQCDRCKTRFQVFPGRREEDGALTSGGTCTYHPTKPRRPQAKDRADKGHKEAIYACCNETVGESAGCTQATTHVFKISEPKRLALIMPFKETPPKILTPGPNDAVCFDCEMGYTTLGLELIRLTATAWPNGEELLDVLVRPLGEILDLNSRFSGVWPEDYANALSYECRSIDEDNPSKDGEKRLRIVESPSIARDLLFEHLTPESPLIGHALDNDLNATRIIHPSIVDTILLFPHPRGLPLRFGLKALMKRHLDRDVQMGGDQGHDSKEDARAAGDLVRLKISEMWKGMKRDGWTVKRTEFFPPLPSAPTQANPSGTYDGELEA